MKLILILLSTLEEGHLTVEVEDISVTEVALEVDPTTPTRLADVASISSSQAKEVLVQALLDPLVKSATNMDILLHVAIRDLIRNFRYLTRFTVL